MNPKTVRTDLELILQGVFHFKPPSVIVMNDFLGVSGTGIHPGFRTALAAADTGATDYSLYGGGRRGAKRCPIKALLTSILHFSVCWFLRTLF